MRYIVGLRRCGECKITSSRYQCPRFAVRKSGQVVKRIDGRTVALVIRTQKLLRSSSSLFRAAFTCRGRGGATTLQQAGRRAGGGRPRRLCVIAGEHDICSDLFDRRSSRRLRQLRGETPIKHRAKLPRRVDRHDGYERRRASTPWCPYDGYNFDSTAVRLHIKGH